MRLPPRLLVPLVAAGSLVVGFAVAQGAGQRWLGAIVLLVGGLACAGIMLPLRGFARTAVLAVVYVAGFVLSHPLGMAIGSWPSVIVVAAVTAVVGYLLMGPTSSRVSTTSLPTSSTR